MEPLISVIVPIYKVESYLRQCVDSILNQTYTNLEIILVDDGSPDNCGAICDEYAAKDSRVRVFHKPNGGLSDARNAGMKIMTADYLMFVDSDDWMELHAVELLYSLMKEHDASIVIGGQKQFEDGTNQLLFTNCHGPVKAIYQSKTEAMEAMLRYGCTVWGRLYRREIHQGIWYPSGTVHEDEAIMLPLLERCSRIVKINEPIYCYRCRANSITNSAFAVKNLDWYKEGKKHLAWILQNHPELEKVARERFYTSIYLHLMEMTTAGKEYWKYAKPLLKDLRENYSDMKRWALQENKGTLRLLLMRWLPYPVFYYVIKSGRQLIGGRKKTRLKADD